MRTRFPRSVLFLTACVTVGLTVLSSCTQDVTSSTPTTTPRIPADAPTATVAMTSADSTLYKAGPSDQLTYGQNRLVGKAVVAGQPANVEILGNVQYVRGTGPFYGFLTVTWANGSSVAFVVQGTATLEDSGATKLASSLVFLAGTGEYENGTAVGRFTGARAAQVGSPIVIRLTMAATAGTPTKK